MGATALFWKTVAHWTDVFLARHPTSSECIDEADSLAPTKHSRSVNT